MASPVINPVVKDETGWAYQQTINGSGYLRYEVAVPCFECHELTKLLSIDFEGPIHAMCAELAWRVVLAK